MSALETIDIKTHFNCEKCRWKKMYLILPTDGKCCEHCCKREENK